MQSAPAVRRESIMDSGTGAPSPIPQPPPPSSAPANAGSGGLLFPGNSSSNSSRRPTFLITPATTSQHGRRPSIVPHNSNSGVGGGTAAPPPVVLYKAPCENTYQVAPEKPFSTSVAKRVLREVMEETLEGRQYDREACRQLTSSLAEAINRRVKELGHPRYKLVTNVAIGQADSASLAMTSRCVWNDSFDSFAEYTYRNGSLYAVGLVHAIYCD